MQEINLSSISSTTNIIEGSERANILLPRGTKLCVDNALYSSKNNRNLLSFKDIHLNGYHIKKYNEGNIEYLYITRLNLDKKCVSENLLAFSYGLYYMYISIIETHNVVN
ncbi:hypothetical protein AAZX31_14G149000 [Glycine max]|uniref:Uncharacterized protein n=1 Tax=Glycine max TaxID=3847 RepID=A0A0R0KMA4_SOYBN|nr:hypothetical protein GLYMA_14G132040v4 [Glycine max]KAG4954561.1 hypothetical protein JHK87_040155 [Glycine soja]KAG4963476.1 hypothetical protein JHK86_040344 [Glycine max]KAG4965956.1 hypothetical protein JHK85_040931 [Glycine max]KAG5110921.1 hypothetical protein JHK82_040144 [Glycine max]